jgi:hypothetical protein
MNQVEKQNYYQTVISLKVKKIVNDTTRPDATIVYELAQLLNYCNHCKHCKADLNTAELVCQAGGRFDFNDLNCKRDERQIKPNCYTF